MVAVSYALTSADLAPDAQTVLRSDGAFIPPDQRNADFAAYLAWVAAGNAPSPAPIRPAEVPPSVSRRQFFQAAAHLGVITEDDALSVMTTGALPAALASAIAALPSNQQFPAKMAVVGAQDFVRVNPIMAAIAAAMDKTDADLDALFTLAASL